MTVWQVDEGIRMNRMSAWQVGEEIRFILMASSTSWREDSDEKEALGEGLGKGCG
jgi:hypothetical protein